MSAKFPGGGRAGSFLAGSLLSLASGDKLVIGCIYRSPHCTAKNISKLFNMLINVCARNLSHILIIGDFNFKEIDWTF